jgi:hypothetical protein
LSEVLNEKVASSDENGFSRRRVVAGVAWSLPVIATAIAAPAAAASGVNAVAAFDGVGSAVAFPEQTASGQNRTGSGPTGFHIKNNGSAITGSITGLIRIEPVPAATGDPGVGVRTLTNATMVSPSLSAANVFTATFSIPGLASNGTASVLAGFYYKGKKNQTRSFLMSLTITYPDNKVETISTNIALT